MTNDPTDPGQDVEVLREHVRHLERRVRQLSTTASEGNRMTTSNTGHGDVLPDGLIDDLSREMVKGGQSVNWLCRKLESAILAALSSASSGAGVLPPLPEAANDARQFGRAGFTTAVSPAYTAEQMRDYAHAAILAATQRAEPVTFFDRVRALQDDPIDGPRLREKIEEEAEAAANATPPAAEADAEKARKYDHLLPYLCKTCGGFGLLDRRTAEDPLGSEPCPDCTRPAAPLSEVKS